MIKLHTPSKQKKYQLKNYEIISYFFSTINRNDPNWYRWLIEDYKINKQLSKKSSDFWHAYRHFSKKKIKYHYLVYIRNIEKLDKFVNNDNGESIISMTEQCYLSNTLLPVSYYIHAFDRAYRSKQKNALSVIANIIVELCNYNIIEAISPIREYILRAGVGEYNLTINTICRSGAKPKYSQIWNKWFFALNCLEDIRNPLSILKYQGDLMKSPSKETIKVFLRSGNLKAINELIPYIPEAYKSFFVYYTVKYSIANKDLILNHIIQSSDFNVSPEEILEIDHKIKAKVDKANKKTKPFFVDHFDLINKIPQCYPYFKKYSLSYDDYEPEENNLKNLAL